MTRSLNVSPGAASERLDVYLAKTLRSPRSQVQRLLKAGDVVVNGAAGRPSYLIQAGDRVEITESIPEIKIAAAPVLPVVYEDDDLIVVDKPAGLAVHPGAGSASRAVATVADFARLHVEDNDEIRPGIVHRLDRDTSGLLILAKHPAAKAVLQAAFKSHRIAKTYRLLLIGRLPHDLARINLPIGRHPARPLKQAVLTGGRKASTDYRALRYFRGYTLAEAKPLSGRTHQLRVHFAAIGHPVAGDTTYGPPQRPLGLNRQFLHAAGLQFTTPSGQKIELSSALPTDLSAVLAKLEAQEVTQ